MIKRKHIICESYILHQKEAEGPLGKISPSKDSKEEEEDSKPFHKRMNHFEGMDEDEIKFFTPTNQGELLSCNYRLSLHKALQDYLME